MVKNFLVYLSLVFFEIAFAFAYGFLLQNTISVEIAFLLAFCIPLIVLIAFSKNSQDKIKKKLLTALVISLLLGILFLGVLTLGNQLYGEFVAEYTVVVESVHGKGGSTAEFTAPDGDYASVDLHDYRIILTEQDDYVTAGDVIKIQEYKGIFGQPFYKFVEKLS